MCFHLVVHVENRPGPLPRRNCAGCRYLAGSKPEFSVATPSLVPIWRRKCPEERLHELCLLIYGIICIILCATWQEVSPSQHRCNTVLTGLSFCAHLQTCRGKDPSASVLPRLCYSASVLVCYPEMRIVPGRMSGCLWVCNFFPTTLCHLLLRFFSQSHGKSNDDEKPGSHWNVLFLISSNISKWWCGRRRTQVSHWNVMFIGELREAAGWPTKYLWQLLHFHLFSQYF